MNENNLPARFPPEVLTGFVNDLLGEKGGTKQREFLEFVLNGTGKDFANFVENILKGEDSNKKIYEGKQDLIPSFQGLPINLTAGHMDMVSAEDSLSLYSAWKDKLTYPDAALPGVWGAITLKAIHDGSIRSPSWLLIKAGQPDAEKAKSDLATILKNKKGNKVESMDRHVRRVLRSLMGPKEIRGRPTLYTNCPLARAWWIGVLVEDISRIFEQEVQVKPLDKKQIADALICQWRTLSDTATAKLTTLINRDILGGIVLAISEAKHRKINTETMKLICRALGEEAAGRILSVKSAKDIAIQNIKITD